MVFVSLTEAETDAKSPVDDALWAKVRGNFEDLNDRVVVAGNAPYAFQVDGPLSRIRNFKRSLAGAVISKEFSPSICRFTLKKSGTSATLSFDIRKHTAPRTEIRSIVPIYIGSITSIARSGPALSTQSVNVAGNQIATQSITFAFGTIAVQSIIGLGGNRWQYNLASAINQSYTVAGDTISFASCSNAANNGVFPIVDIARAGGDNIVVTNASGVAQTGAAGTCQPPVMSYNFTNPVVDDFAVAENVIFASHSNAANDGTFSIIARNNGGNNLWVKNSAGVAQGGAAGNTNCTRWIHSMSSPVSGEFVVGERAVSSGHTSGGNDGTFTIVGVNISGGNNIVLANTTGVAQGGVAGSIVTTRWAYNVGTDPQADTAANDSIVIYGASSAANNGTFTLKARSGSSMVVTNESGVAQGGAAGTIASALKAISFASDQSAVYTTNSFVELVGCPAAAFNYAPGKAPFRVVQVNRGGGSNYNVVVSVATAEAQSSPAGHVAIEMKSVFNSPQGIAVSTSGYFIVNQMISGYTDGLVAEVIPENTPLMLYFTDVSRGDPRDFAAYLS